MLTLQLPSIPRSSFDASAKLYNPRAEGEIVLLGFGASGIGLARLARLGLAPLFEMDPFFLMANQLPT